jgi:hypothetical protein
MTTTLYLLTLMLPLATILIVFGMRYFAKIQEARARLANDDAYRQLAETASATQSRIAASLSVIETALSDVRARLAAVETILKSVE